MFFFDIFPLIHLYAGTLKYMSYKVQITHDPLNIISSLSSGHLLVSLDLMINETYFPLKTGFVLFF